VKKREGEKKTEKTNTGGVVAWMTKNGCSDEQQKKERVATTQKPRKKAPEKTELKKKKHVAPDSKKRPKKPREKNTRPVNRHPTPSKKGNSMRNHTGLGAWKAPRRGRG